MGYQFKIVQGYFFHFWFCNSDEPVDLTANDVASNPRGCLIGWRKNLPFFVIIRYGWVIASTFDHPLVSRVTDKSKYKTLVLAD